MAVEGVAGDAMAGAADDGDDAAAVDSSRNTLNWASSIDCCRET